jgi:hypothetical protein
MTTTPISIPPVYYGVLTTAHPASSYGIPVIVINGQPYGPADRIEIGEDVRPIGELDIRLNVARVGEDVIAGDGSDLLANLIATADATHKATEAAWTVARQALAAWRAQLAETR